MKEFTDEEIAMAAEMARQDFYFFSRWMFLNTKGFKWMHNWHHKDICDALTDVVNGKIKRLIINIPPRYSKTELAVVNFMAWCLGHFPDSEFIHASYSSALANENSYKCREMILSQAYQNVFPFTKVRDDSKAKNHWKTSSGGVVYAAGTEGTITGFGAGKKRKEFGGCIIIDDPHKASEATSDVIRNNVLNWFQTTLESRKNDPKETPIIVIMQRLHEVDLAGWLLDGGNGEEWTHINIPVLDGDTPLWPEMHSLEELRRMESSNAYMFSGQYMQSPSPDGGGAFKPEQLKIVDVLPEGKIEWVRGWDLASSTSGDFTVGGKIGRLSDGRYVIADILRIKATPDERDRAIVNTTALDGIGCKVSIPQDPGQAGKPIWEKEMILMFDGSRKELSKVVVGDSVIGKDGMPHTVSEVFIQGNLECVKIITESGREVIAAYDHPFLTPDGWINAIDLNINDTLALRSCPSIINSCLRSNEEFRLAGYFVGDGAVGRSKKSGSKGSCNAEFTCNDEVQLNDFRLCVESIGGEVVNRKNPNQFGTKGLQDWLRETDIAGHTAYNKRVPDWVFLGSPEQISNFIGAYFACDGTVSKQCDDMIFYSVSKELLVDVQHLLLRIGISSTLKTKNGKYLETRHRSWMLRTRQQDDAYGRFARRIPLFHSLKQERLRIAVEKARFRRFNEEFLPDRISSIEKIGLMPCRCLTVDNDHSFLVDDIVVHNTQVAYLTRELAGYRVISSPESGSKETRAEPLAAQINVGNVMMLRAEWNANLVHEMRMFPNGRHDDQVDALSRAFSELVKSSGGIKINPDAIRKAKMLSRFRR